MAQDDPDNTIEEELTEGYSGQHFYMDFGFVHSTVYRIKQEDTPTTTSIDGFNSYLTIVDRFTRYLWIFLTTSMHLL